ncbi:MAG: DNA polymerase III subunit delta [Alphaproteobacteria bacterium]|nr:DNA polymerase III subunit delta [Alphaproteobacteria bacterium]
MKVPPRGLDGFLASPPTGLRAALIYGPDIGKVKETAGRLARTVVADPSDPFNVAMLDGDEVEADPARLADEAAARSLMGGRRLVWVREARDRAAEAIATALDGPETDTLVIIEGGDLKTGGGLRKLFEANRPDLAAIACYPDDARDLAQLVRDTLRNADIRVSGETVQYLADRLGGDRLATRNELDKLVLLAGPGSTLDLELAMDAIGDSAALAVDTLISAAADGRPEGILPSLDRAFRQGESPIMIQRLALGYFQRLHLAVVRKNAGRNPADAVKSLRPPVFFKAVEPLTRQTARWTSEATARALARLGEAEIHCKSTGYPAEAECGQALIDVARIARLLERGRR